MKSVRNKESWVDKHIPYLSKKDAVEMYVVIFLVLFIFVAICGLFYGGTILNWIGAISGVVAGLISLFTFIYAVQQVNKWNNTKLNERRLDEVITMFILLDSLPNHFNTLEKRVTYKNIIPYDEEKFKKNHDLYKKFLDHAGNGVVELEELINQNLVKLEASFEQYSSVSKLLLINEDVGLTEARSNLWELYGAISIAFADEVNLLKNKKDCPSYYLLYDWLLSQKESIQG